MAIAVTMIVEVVIDIFMTIRQLFDATFILIVINALYVYSPHSPLKCYASPLTIIKSS